MTDHRFALGQTVRLVRGYVFDPDRSAKYRVTKLLPELRYCLEHDEFLFSRISIERELIGLIPSAWGVRPAISPPLKLRSLLTNHSRAPASTSRFAPSS